MFGAKLVIDVPDVPVGAPAVIIFFVADIVAGAEHQMVVDMPLVIVGGNDIGVRF